MSWTYLELEWLRKLSSVMPDENEMPFFGCQSLHRVQKRDQHKRMQLDNWWNSST